MKKNIETGNSGNDLRLPRLLSEMTPEEIEATSDSVIHMSGEDSANRIREIEENQKKFGSVYLRMPRYTDPKTGKVEGGNKVRIK